MESKLVTPITAAAAHLKDRCCKFLTSSLSFVAGLVLPSDGGGDPGIQDVRPERGSVLNLVKIMAGVSVTPVIEVAVVYVQVQHELPTEFMFFCLAVLLAFNCFFVSRCIIDKFPNPAGVLQKAGVFLMFTGVFIIVPVPFPYYFKIITWAVYSISVTAIFLIHYFEEEGGKGRV